MIIRILLHQDKKKSLETLPYSAATIVFHKLTPRHCCVPKLPSFAITTALVQLRRERGALPPPLLPQAPQRRPRKMPQRTIPTRLPSAKGTTPSS
jgi:hypothetical protein